MSKDLQPILEDWPFDPQKFTVRMIRGLDGQDKMQIRNDLGLLQLELHGRPDGLRPHGSESYLAYLQSRQKAHDSASPDGAPYMLETSDCELLLREGMQYYHRYLGFWHLRLFELCARDTRRNLDLLAFVREFARQDSDKLQFDQWRPYLVMMHTKAVAAPLVELRQFDAAIQVAASGIERIEEFLRQYQQQHKAGQFFELQHLIRLQTEWRHKRDQKLPPPLASGELPPPGESAPPGGTDPANVSQTPTPTGDFTPGQPRPAGRRPAPGREGPSASPIKLDADAVLEGLQEQLRQAIAAERFEEAARLRDRIAEMRGGADSA
ncbi:MAG: UvrB/UvrC motif-containing protein [Pirellulales bacterium]|nr:UvrB/UvrC motif-containing protein [Pirellulales bacterium]